MSDKLVSIEMVKELFKRIPANMPFEIAECLLNERLNDVPAVPQEMSADVYLWQRERMCHSFDKATYDPRIDDCEDCPLIDCCSKRGNLEGAEAVDIVDAWAQEHPERSEE